MEAALAVVPEEHLELLGLAENQSRFQDEETRDLTAEKRKCAKHDGRRIFSPIPVAIVRSVLRRSGW